MEATRHGHRAHRRGRVLDVISLGIDQDAQENFFHPERQDRAAHGRGRRAGAQRRRLPRALRGLPVRQLPADAHLFRHR